MLIMFFLLLVLYVLKFKSNFTLTVIIIILFIQFIKCFLKELKKKEAVFPPLFILFILVHYLFFRRFLALATD